jgi:hypothetical protein
MNRPYSIKIYLPDGTPDGLKIIEKSNWNGKGVVCPRSSFPDNKAREDQTAQYQGKVTPAIDEACDFRLQEGKQDQGCGLLEKISDFG